MLGVSRKTVRCYLRRDGLPRYTRKLNPYKRYFDE
jgi:hypothetical protein